MDSKLIKPALLVLVILIGFLVYTNFTNSGKLNDALDSIKEAQMKIKSAIKIIEKSQESINDMIGVLDTTQSQLDLIKDEVETGRKQSNNLINQYVYKSEFYQTKLEEKRNDLKGLQQQLQKLEKGDTIVNIYP